MSQESESVQPLTDWQHMEGGFRYRWVLLPKEEVTSLRERLERPRENIDSFACSKDKGAVPK